MSESKNKSISKLYELVVYNDEKNSFEDVIVALMEECQHNPYQAEQCALIIDAKGKYTVKHGPIDEVLYLCSKLVERGLIANIK